MGQPGRSPEVDAALKKLQGVQGGEFAWPRVGYMSTYCYYTMNFRALEYLGILPSCYYRCRCTGRLAAIVHSSPVIKLISCRLDLVVESLVWSGRYAFREGAAVDTHRQVACRLIAH